ncbi:uncharacterized protein C8A04DRAFT_28345 [Dichotomopilus funicola]|uniref:Uncharacterized protein n=1 Tax=Dichotomopilus funicola TaxID=1934379 RepID=A0AAN6V3D1_9PEZI|nr:hypothetical protein C8A04DRAFT_28345 [Dichotomopilus funicola]
MSDFSLSAAAATVRVLFEDAQSILAQVELALSNDTTLASTAGDGDNNNNNTHPQQLSTLRARLQLFSHHTKQATQIILDAPVIHPQFAQVLQSGLEECQSAVNVVTGGVGSAVKTGEGAAAGAVAAKRDVLDRYTALFGSYVRFFSLSIQLLIMETEKEQETMLADAGVTNIVNDARQAAERVLSLSR